MKVLVLGANGMLGNAVFRVLSEKEDWEVFGTVRSGEMTTLVSPKRAERLVVGCDVEKDDALVKVFGDLRPDVVVNCISLAKRLLSAGDPLLMIPIYSLLPHRLAGLCKLAGARLVHISTDGVFSGAKGSYTEDDPPDAKDLYGIVKYLGEVRYPHTITLRTSIIGHGLKGTSGLIDWFLSQSGSCKGFSRVIYSGLPTVTVAQLLRDVVIPRPDLSGLYHLSSNPISKHALLQLVADVYGKAINIIEDDSVAVDRSLNSKRFESATGYIAPDWPELISDMRADWGKRLE